MTSLNTKKCIDTMYISVIQKEENLFSIRKKNDKTLIPDLETKMYSD